VIAGARKGVLAILLILLLEKLNQAINQPATATNHMQTALVLVLFQDFIQVLFQFGHRISPLECRSSGAHPKPDISFFQGMAAEDWGGPTVHRRELPLRLPYYSTESYLETEIRKFDDSHRKVEC